MRDLQREEEKSTGAGRGPHTLRSVPGETRAVDVIDVYGALRPAVQSALGIGHGLVTTAGHF